MPVRVNKVNAGTKDICNPAPAPVRGYIKPHYHYYPHTTTTHPGERPCHCHSAALAAHLHSLCVETPACLENGEPRVHQQEEGPPTFAGEGQLTCPNDASKCAIAAIVVYPHAGLKTSYISGMCCRKDSLNLISSALIMKGTKVLTLGVGREVLPHNMAVTKM